MSSRYRTGIRLLLVVIAGLPLACEAKPGTAGQSATASLTPEQLKQVDLIKIPNQNSPVEISPEQLGRMKLMKFLGADASLAVFPVRINGKTQDAASARDLAKKINDAGLCQAEPAKQSLLITASLDDPNEMNKLFSMAGEFRDYVKKSPPNTDYALYSDYMFTPKWEFVMVHFVVCDQQGEWVILDLQNAHHPDYQSINPKSEKDCNKLVVKRLESWLRAEATATPMASVPAAGPHMDPTEAQKVLDQLLGTWDCDATVHEGVNAPERSLTTRSTFARILGGTFLQETIQDSDNNTAIILYTYEEAKQAYRSWFFSSNVGHPEPSTGRWNEAARTLDWSSANNGYPSIVQHRFLDANTWECSCEVKDPAGNALFRGEYKVRRAKDPTPVVPSQTGNTGGPLPEEQKVLDRFLGDWSWEVTTYSPGSSPEEQHSTGRSSYARVLGGRFVEETGEDSEEGLSLVLYTYDQRQECYLLRVFLSKYRGPDAPFKGKWNEATRSIEWVATTDEGHSITNQHHFVSDDAFEAHIVARDSAGQVLWRQEFKFTRDGNPQEVSPSGVAYGTEAYEYNEKEFGEKIYGRKTPDEEFKYLDEWIAAKPNDLVPLSYKYVLGAQTGRPAEALEAGDRLLQLQQDTNKWDAGDWRDRAVLLFEVGRYDEAIPCCGMSIELSPLFAEPWYVRAKAHALTGNRANALADLGKAIELQADLKSDAAKNPAFKSMGDDSDFKKLTQ